jgi:hypothetical protein
MKGEMGLPYCSSPQASQACPENMACFFSPKCKMKLPALGLFEDGANQ